MTRIILVVVAIGALTAACGNAKSSPPKGPTYVGNKIVTAQAPASPKPSRATPTVAATSSTPAVPVKIISVTDGHPGSNATVTAQTAPDATCSIAYHHPSGKLSTTKGLEPQVTKPDGTVSWTFRIDSTTKAGNGDIAVTCNGVTAYHVIAIKVP